MPSKFSSGKFAIAECDRCGQRYKLTELRTQVLKTKKYSVKVCKSCYDPDHPQLQLGMYEISDPQAVREPRPDVSYYSSGNTGLYISDVASNSIDNAGYPGEGSRQIQWGWNPVGMGYNFGETPNDLIGTGVIGVVTITGG